MAKKKEKEEKKQVRAEKKGKVIALPKEEPKPKPVEKDPLNRPDPVWVEQLNDKGIPEQVDFNVYCNVITCQCGNIRYVKNADRHQVTMCKPCAKRERRRRIRARRKERGKVSKFVEEKKAKKAAKK